MQFHDLRSVDIFTSQAPPLDAGTLEPRSRFYFAVASRDRDIMTYASLFGEECSIAEVQRILASDWNEGNFCTALKEASAAFASNPKSHKVSLTHVFKRCVSILSEQNKSHQEEGLGSANIDQELETDKLTLSQFHNADLETPSTHPRLDSSEKAPNSSNHDDGDDITDITNTETTPLDLQDTEEMDPPIKAAEAKSSASEAEEIGESAKEHANVPEFNSKMASNIFRAFKTWFNILSHEPINNNHNLLLAVFPDEPCDDLLSDADLSSLLLETKTFLGVSIKKNDPTMAEFIKEAIHMLHEILAAIFKTIELEAKHGTPQTALTLKKMLHGFYDVDFSTIFESLLELTTSKLLFSNDQKEAKALSEKMTADQSLRLSYVTLSKILVCMTSLANCPKNLFLGKKSSDSSDITAIGDNYLNVYSQTMKKYNFADPKNVSLFESRIIPYLAAEFNFYYELSPDLLQYSLKHSSFFAWITGDALSSSSYLYTHTVKDLTDFENQSLDSHDPFLYEVEYFEHKLKLRKAQSGNQQNHDLSCASYLLMSTLFLLYVDNSSFVEYICKSKDSRIPLLSIWLCVSSYVHHYQYKSEINKHGTRVFLFAMLKLTSSSSEFMKLANDYTINESSWKFCHHKAPLIPVNKENENQPVLFYLMDVLQVTFRFNLSRKLSLTNVKLALTVLYQILSYYEAHPTDDLKSYHWKELFVSLTTMIRFIAKSHNEEGVKLIVEETFATFDLLLSPIFDKVIVDTVGTKLFGSHLIKSLNYDLLYIMLHQRESLSALFTKYIVQTDNFPRVEKAFDTFEEKLSAIKTPEISQHDVEQMISKLSILSDEEVCLTSIALEDFNNIETFKYLDRFIDESSKQIQQNSVISQLLLANEWTAPKE